MDQWLEDWQLYFNPSKCKCQHMVRNNKKYVYTMRENGKYVPFEETTLEKDLGGAHEQKN